MMSGRFVKRMAVRSNRSLVAVLLLSLLAVGAYALFVYRLRPVVRDLAKAEVNAVLTDMINKAVMETLDEQQVSYDEMVFFEKDEQGRVSALRTNAALLNGLRASIENKVLSYSENTQSVKVTVPMGAVAGANVFAEAGPTVNVKMSTAKEINGSFVSRFSETAINQSIHRLVFSGQISCTLLYPGENDHIDVDFSVVAAETVIVGDVPESYTYFSGVETTDDAIDYYYNYR